MHAKLSDLLPHKHKHMPLQPVPAVERQPSSWLERLRAWLDAWLDPGRSAPTCAGSAAMHSVLHAHLLNDMACPAHLRAEVQSHRRALRESVLDRPVH